MTNLAPLVVIALFSILAGSLAFFSFKRLALDHRLQFWSEFAERWGDRIFLGVAFLYVVVFTLLALARYLTFHTGYLDVNTSWDLGQYNQLIYNSLNGRLLEGTFVTDTRTFLGKSFTPILLAFVPLYALWQSPMILLVIQVLGLGLGGIPLYWTARQRLGRGLALVIGISYFLFPGLESIGLVEFHEIALAVPLLSLAMFFLMRRQYAGFFVSLGVAMLVKEEVTLIAAMLGVYIFLFQRNRRLGALVFFASVIWFVFLVQSVIPFFRGAEYGSTFYYFGQGTIGGGGTRYSWLGRSIPEIVTTLVARPAYVVQAILIPEKVYYLFALFAPLAFVPLIGFAELALALPTLGYSLLSMYGLQYEIRSYYFAPLLAFLFFALVTGVERGVKSGSRIARNAAFGVTLLAAAVATYWLQSPGPLGGGFEPNRYAFTEHSTLGNQLTAMIPADAVVVAQSEYLAQLSNRQAIYEIPLIDYRQADYMFADSTMGWYDVHRGFWERARASGYFDTLVDQDGFWVAKRQSPAYASNIRFGDHLILQGYRVAPENLRGGIDLRPIVQWQGLQPIGESYAMTARVVDAWGHTWVEQDGEPQDGELPTPKWQPGKSVGDQYTLPLPPTMPAGDYQITVGVHISGTLDYMRATNQAGEALGDEITLATVRIEKDKSSHSVNDIWWLIPERLTVDLGDLRMLGYTPPRQSIKPGELMSLGICWRARKKPTSDYFVTVQLRDALGQVAYEQRARPAHDAYATTLWDEGEVLMDWHDFVLPATLKPGEYQIVVGLQDAIGGARIGDAPISKITVVE